MTCTLFCSWDVEGEVLKFISLFSFIQKASTSFALKLLHDAHQNTVHGDDQEIHFKSTLLIQTKTLVQTQPNRLILSSRQRHQQTRFRLSEREVLLLFKGNTFVKIDANHSWLVIDFCAVICWELHSFRFTEAEGDR